MKNTLMLCVLLCATLFSGCYQGILDETTVSFGEEKVLENDLRIEPGMSSISADEAARVALLFGYNSSETTKSYSKKIDEVRTIYGKDNNAAICCLIRRSGRFYPGIIF